MSFLQQGLKYMLSTKNFYFTPGTGVKQQNINIPAA
jgi:hypothetical protein